VTDRAIIDKSLIDSGLPQCRAGADMPFCQALAPAAVAAFAWAIFRLTIALGGSCCAIAQRLAALTMAIPLIPMPHKPIAPPVAMRAKPTIMALEFGELICMPVVDDRVVVIVSPDVGPAQMPSVPGWIRGPSPSPGDVAIRTAVFGPPSEADAGIHCPLRMTFIMSRHTGMLCT
jgi:hypothetical protein